MRAAPLLTLVDPRAQRRAAVRQRIVSVTVGALIAGACAVPYALAFAH